MSSREPADPSYEAKREFFRNAFRLLDFNQIRGDYCEFGCNTAVTFRLAHEGLAQRDNPLSRHMWAFDSFAGLPPQRSKFDSHPVWVEGTLVTSLEDFRRLCGEYGIPPERYSCVAGFYEDSLPAAADPEEVALAHVDCDLYTSAVEVMNWLAPRMRNGMVVAFDDYFCASADQLAGERRALIEFQREHERWRWVPYIQYWWAAQSFLIEDRALDP